MLFFFASLAYFAAKKGFNRKVRKGSLDKIRVHVFLMEALYWFIEMKTSFLESVAAKFLVLNVTCFISKHCVVSFLFFHTEAQRHKGESLVPCFFVPPCLCVRKISNFMTQSPFQPHFSDKITLDCGSACSE